MAFCQVHPYDVLKCKVFGDLFAIYVYIYIYVGGLVPRLFVFGKEHRKQERKRTHGDLVEFCNLKVFFVPKGMQSCEKKDEIVT